MDRKAETTSLFILLVTTLFLFGVNLCCVTKKSQEKPKKEVYVANKATRHQTNKKETKPSKKKIDKPDARKEAKKKKQNKTTSNKVSFDFDKKTCNKSNSSNFITHVTLTAYHPVKEQCNNEPHIMANNQKVDFKGLKNGTFKVCAISRDLKWILPFGTKIHIDGYGTYIVCDLMNKRYNHCIDIMLHPSDKNTFRLERVKIKKLV